MPNFVGYDFALVVACGLTRFTRGISYAKHITEEGTIKILLEKWFRVYGPPKEINSDEDVRVHPDTLAGIRVSGGPSRSKCLLRFLTLIQVTLFVSDKSKLSRRKSGYGARLNAQKIG